MNVLRHKTNIMQKLNKKNVTLTQFVNKLEKAYIFSKINIYIKLTHFIYLS